MSKRTASAIALALAAAALATSWSQTFVEQVRLRSGAAEGINSFIEATPTQVAQLPRDRSIALSTYLFAGAVAFLALASFFVLFFHRQG